METAAGASPHLCLAAQSYHTAGAQCLLDGQRQREHRQESVSKGTLEIGQASRLRDRFHIKSGRKQEALLAGRESFILPPVLDRCDGLHSLKQWALPTEGEAGLGAFPRLDMEGCSPEVP